MRVLEINNLSVKNSDNVYLLKNITFTLNKGEKLAIIGESGSGKSLSMLSAISLLPDNLHATGQIKLGETNMLPILPDSAAKMRARGSYAAVIFQEPRNSLDPLMKISKQFEIVLKRQARIKGQKILKNELVNKKKELLQQVNLLDYERILSARPDNLSGGQLQRIAIALALACEPEIIIADEATTALDVTVQAEIIDLINNLVSRNNISLIFVSHDIALVKKISDNILVLKSGEIIEHAATNQIINSPRHPYTKQLIDYAKSWQANI